MSAQRGSASIVVAAALTFAALFAAFAADLSRIGVGRARAQTAADAAALAVAQELVQPSGRPPEEVAAEYAAAHGARMLACACAADGDDVTVRVALDVTLPFLAQTRTVLASARAVVVASAGSEGLRPFFAARLGCLFGRVPGLSIISGFRSRAEQARLYEAKPHLAAPPGHSNHELGLAADLGYPSDAVADAAHRSAVSCGLEFPLPHEPWHVEPVGI